MHFRKFIMTCTLGIISGSFNLSSTVLKAYVSIQINGAGAKTLLTLYIYNIYVMGVFAPAPKITERLTENQTKTYEF